jgi:hypothetical protein
MCVLWPGFHWVGLLISVMFDTCFHLIIFTVAGGMHQEAGVGSIGLSSGRQGASWASDPSSSRHIFEP